MAVTCSCGLDVPGAVARTEVARQVKDGIAEKVGPVKLENTRLLTELSTAQTKSQGYDAIVTERDTLKAQIESGQQLTARTAALTDAKIGGPIDLPTAEMFFNSHNAGLEDDAKLDWATWVKDVAATHPVIAPHVGAAAAAGGAADAGGSAGAAGGNAGGAADAAGGAGGAGANGNPAINGGAGDAGGTGGRMDDAALNAFIASPAFTNLDSAGKKAKLSEISAQHVG